MILDYHVRYTKQKIDLNLWEAEMYFAAIPVQQLIGNLVYYSNMGRYEPRLAKSWERVKPNLWKFQLRSNLRCENGEEITPSSFKKSLERSLLIQSTRGGSPVLKKLKGYSSFLEANKAASMNSISGIDGIYYAGDEIFFEFEKSTRSGVLQILSFAPYGYICAENIGDKGQWLDGKKFISSGAYRLHSIEPGRKITLYKRDDFAISNVANAPKVVNFYQSTLAEVLAIKTQNSVIIDTFDPSEVALEKMVRFDMVKEYMPSIILGNLETGLFSSGKYRKLFSQFLKKEMSAFEELNAPFKFSTSMYPTQSQVPLNRGVSDVEVPLSLENVLTIQGEEPKAETSNLKSWKVLKSTLDSLGIKYKFSNRFSDRSDLTNVDYDIRMSTPSVGGGVEAWLIDVLFCSKLNAHLPDPTGAICDLVDKYEEDLVTEEQLTEKFLRLIEDDAALFPITHLGGTMYLSKDVSLKSISPLISVIRFDQLEIIK